MYNFSKALEEKRYSQEGVDAIKNYLDFDGKEYIEENIQSCFTEYGFDVFNSFCKFVKYYGKKMKDTISKKDISEWIDLDWCALDDTIDKTKKREDLKLIELNNKNIIIVKNI